MPSLSEFAAALTTNPLLLLSMVLVGATIFVNGATDAANAIAEAVGTRSITFEGAIALSVACNFLGLAGSVAVSTAVADTISGMVDFGGDSHAALVALSAAMVAIVVWGVAAWAFGIPTSESHALIAGLSGAAIAVSGGPDGINFNEWVKVIYGLVFSTVLGFGLGWAITHGIRHAFAETRYSMANRIMSHLQIVGAAFGALMHGAQDGQKFMSTATIIVGLALGAGVGASEGYPLWLMLACAVIMSVGTAVGGKKIIKTVGTQMVRLDKYQGAAASLSAGISLLLATFGGMPVSTTHTKTAAIMGAGASKSIKHVDWAIAYDMVLTWVLTFPGCGLIGYVLAWLFLRVF